MIQSFHVGCPSEESLSQINHKKEKMETHRETERDDGREGGTGKRERAIERWREGGREIMTGESKREREMT